MFSRDFMIQRKVPFETLYGFPILNRLSVPRIEFRQLSVLYTNHDVDDGIVCYCQVVSFLL